MWRTGARYGVVGVVPIGSMSHFTQYTVLESNVGFFFWKVSVLTYFRVMGFLVPDC